MIFENEVGPLVALGYKLVEVDVIDVTTGAAFEVNDLPQ